MGRLHCKTTGSATNSGSTDTDAASLTGVAATVAGSVVTLDGAPDLSGLQTSGVNQSSIFLNDATNANRKIFWITAFDNVAKTVTVDVAPTGVVSSAWAIGGRVVLTNASQEGALRAGDEFIFHDSPATANAVRWTFRTAGTSTAGFAAIKNDGTAYFQLIATGTTAVLATAVAYCEVQGLDIIQQGASGVAYSPSGNNCLIFNCKFTDSGDVALSVANGGIKIIGCEFSGTGSTDAIQLNTETNCVVWGCYIHDNARDGIRISNTSMNGVITFCLIEGNGGRGIHYNAGSPTTATQQQGLIGNCTVYGNDDSGFEVNDVDYRPILLNNIFKDNGNAAGEFNIDYPAQVYTFSAFNCFNAGGGRGGGNLNNFTASALDSTANPVFENAAGGDFRLASSSPFIGVSFPGLFPGGGSNQGYLSAGALQPDPSGGGGGGSMMGNIGKRCLVPGYPLYNWN